MKKGDPLGPPFASFNNARLVAAGHRLFAAGTGVTAGCGIGGTAKTKGQGKGNQKGFHGRLHLFDIRLQAHHAGRLGGGGSGTVSCDPANRRVAGWCRAEIAVRDKRGVSVSSAAQANLHIAVPPEVMAAQSIIALSSQQ